MKQSSDAKTMLKEAFVLFLITLVAGVVLGFVHELTKEPIARAQEQKMKEACQAVFAQAADFTEYDYAPSQQVLEQCGENGVRLGTVFEAKGADGEVLGYVVESVSTRGYGGNIVLYTGVTKEGTVLDVSILEISETPGLGMQAEKVLVPQFHQKQVEQFTFTKTGSRTDSEIDAISSATITTRAFTNAVNAALAAAKEMTGGVR